MLIFLNFLVQGYQSWLRLLLAQITNECFDVQLVLLSLQYLSASPYRNIYYQSVWDYTRWIGCEASIASWKIILHDMANLFKP